MNVNSDPIVAWAPPTNRETLWWAMPTVLVRLTMDVMQLE